MVDALSRASRWVEPPLGRVIDLRPAHGVPQVELGPADGRVVSAGALAVDTERETRHRNADAAVRDARARGILTLENEDEFAFYRYADSADELRDYIATKFRHTRMDAPTHAHAASLMRRRPGARLWLREQAAIRELRPAAAAAETPRRSR